MSAARKVLEEALKLSPTEREELVATLAESLEEATLGPEWLATVEARMARIERGEASFVDAHEHLAELRAKYGG